jgi:hypothetical protein
MPAAATRKMSDPGDIRSRRLCHLWAILLIFAPGCGPHQKADPNRSTVSGNVTFDGKPLRAGVITFALVDGHTASTVSLNEGRFSSDRVPVGVNQVSIETESLKYGSGSLYVQIPAKYGDPSKSGLQVELKPGEKKEVNFELKK